VARRLASTVGLCLLLALIGACGSGQQPVPSPSPTSSAASVPVVAFPVPSKAFDSAQLGIAFRYPAVWTAHGDVMISQFDTTGGANLAFYSSRGVQPQGLVEVAVNSARFFQDKPPLPHASAELLTAKERALLAKTAKIPVADIGYLSVGGLRLLEQNMTKQRDFIPGSHAACHVTTFLSGTGEPPFATTVQIVVAFPQTSWHSDQGLLRAVLASFRFATPKVTWENGPPAPSPG